MLKEYKKQECRGRFGVDYMDDFEYIIAETGKVRKENDLLAFEFLRSKQIKPIM